MNHTQKKICKHRCQNRVIVTACLCLLQFVIAITAQADTAEGYSDFLTRWIETQNPVCDAPGGVLLVDGENRNFLEGAGVSSLQTQEPVRLTDRFEIGSNSKTFTVVLALQLQEAGALEMDDRLEDWLPELAARIPNGNLITLRHLAANTSGIADYADPLMQPIVDTNDRVGLAKAYTPLELVEFALKQEPPGFLTGEGWDYSSTNFILLGMVVEKATGKGLSDLYREQIFAPLGMNDSTYLEASPEAGALINGYYRLPDGDRADMTAWNASQGGAAGAIVSTVADMQRFVSGLFDMRLFEKRSTLEEMLSFRELTPEEGGGIIEGYGLGLISFNVPGETAVGHAGQTPGFQTLWFHRPESDETVILLTNSGSCAVMLLAGTLAGIAAGSDDGM